VNNPTLISIQQRMAEDYPIGKADETTVRRLWWAALDTLQEDILLPMNKQNGIWISAPLPALYEPKLLQSLTGWVWGPDEFEFLNSNKSGLLPPSDPKNSNKYSLFEEGNYKHLKLKTEDGSEPLLIILTSKVQIALTVYGPANKRSLIIKTDKKSLDDIISILHKRLHLDNSLQASELKSALSNRPKIRENNLDKLFWPLLTYRLANIAPSLTLQPLNQNISNQKSINESNKDISILEAITHEVRTPLATIRTLIRSLIRRKDLNELVIQRLKQIDSECTEQIDRFGLIFNAAEIQKQKPDPSRLASTDLGRMLKMLQPSWEDLLKRREIKLKIDIIPDLPEILSDPERLELMLGGLIDRNTRGLKPGGTLSLELRPAGQRLKLEILCKTIDSSNSLEKNIKQNSDLGTVLSWDPETGSLQLSHAATQKLLASLGGRLTKRRDSILTIFFPIAESKY